MNTNKRLIAIAVALAWLLASRADAAFMMRLSLASGPTATITDGGAGDNIPGTSGDINYINTALGSLSVDFTAKSKPTILPPANHESLTGVTINNSGTTAETLLVEIVDNGFAPTGASFVQMSVATIINPTGAASVDYFGFVDAGNTDSFSTGTSYYAGTYSGNSSAFTGFAPTPALPTFSMGLTAIIRLAAGTQVQISEDILITPNPSGGPLTPEPASMAMWGFGLVGLVALRRMRRKV